MKNLTEEMKSYIQYGTDEDRRWEFKPPVKWSNPQCRGEISKTIFALSNIPDGGFIIFGISQEQNRTEGIVFNKKGLSADELKSFDSIDDIGRYLQGKANQEIKFDIHGGDVEIDGLKKNFVVLHVFESKLSIPVICAFDCNTSGGVSCTKRGTIYIRSISNPIESRAIKLNEEWEELILRLLHKKEEIMLKDLKALLNNLNITKPPSIIKKIKHLNKTSEFDRYLKRDKL